MAIETHWKLSADIQAEMTTDAGVLKNVVTTVHWRVFATDGVSGESLSIYGSVAVPPPTSAASYIDLSTLQGKTADEKRATVLGWAEAIQPGFVAEKEAQAVRALERKLAAPSVTAAEIL
jgi:hypothetical protein